MTTVSKMLKFRARIQLGAIAILLIVVLSLLFSQGASPENPLFSLKRVQEKVFLSIKSTPPDKVDYMSSMLESRLRELQSVVNNKNYGYVLDASRRYFTLAGQITDLVVANNLTDKVGVFKEQFLNHRQVLNALYVIYPKNTDDWEWKYIQDDYNYLKLYLDKLDKVK